MIKYLILGLLALILISGCISEQVSFEKTVELTNDVWIENGIQMNGIDYNPTTALDLSNVSLTKIKDGINALGKSNFSEKEKSGLFLEMNKSLINLIIDSKKALASSDALKSSANEICDDTGLREEYILNETKRIDSIKRLEENFDAFDSKYKAEADELNLNKEMSSSESEENLELFKNLDEEIEQSC